jgi:hypothetical protein
MIELLRLHSKLKTDSNFMSQMFCFKKMAEALEAMLSRPLREPQGAFFGVFLFNFYATNSSIAF